MEHGKSRSDEATRVFHSDARAAVVPGTVLNGIYRIERRLGEGGMGEVYLASNALRSDQKAAIKIIAPRLADDPLVEQFFLREADTLYRIHSPAIAQFRLITREPVLGLLYIVTEYVDGPTLAQMMKAGPASAGALVALMLRLATGLKAVHAADCVHRDLSPDNILVPMADPACAKIIDFGIVKDLQFAAGTIGPGMLKGKLGFMAPEQLAEKESAIGPWTDVYGLALTGLAYAAGRPLDLGVTPASAIAARQQPIDLSPLPPPLVPVFQAMLAPDPAARLQSMDAVIAWLEGDRRPAPPPPPPPAIADPVAGTDEAQEGAEEAVAPAPPRRSNWLRIAGAGALGLAAIVGAGEWLTRTPGPVLPVPTPTPSPTPDTAPTDAVTASGLRYAIVAPGDGGARPGPDDVVRVSFRATRADGSLFDAAPQPTALALATLGPGLREGLAMMSRGARYRLEVPVALVRADQRAAGPLTFDVTLHDFTPAALPVASAGQALPLPQPTTAPAPAVPACAAGPFIVFFEWDKADLSSEAETILANAVEQYRACAGAPVTLRAIIADGGRAQAVRRAGAVRNVLARGGIKRSAIGIRTIADPRATSDADNMMFRRVEVRFGAED